ncbi:MAG: metal ABC transporter ATP-binding protein [Myxococcota bacterium]
MSRVLVSLRELGVAYGPHTVLEGVSLEIAEGEIWFLVGSNGSGKTTLLRVLLGDLAPQAGEVWRSPERARPADVGFVPQRSELNESLPTTVREYVSFGLIGLRLTRREAADRLTATLEQVGLSGMEARPYRQLSGGQRQRARLARALIRNPHLLVLDEPTRGLDLPLEERFVRLLLTLQSERRMSVLFVTHDLSLAARHATHIALFHGGRVEAGRASHVLTPSRLEAAYGVPFCVTAADGSGLRVEIQLQEGHG